MELHLASTMVAGDLPQIVWDALLVVLHRGFTSDVWPVTSTNRLFRSQGGKSVINAQRGPKQRTLLMYACSRVDLSFVRRLLTSGAAVNAKDSDGESAVCHTIAASAGSTHEKLAVVRLLCQHGASVNAEDASVNPPLMHAAILGDEVMFNELISLGADRDARCAGGKHLLHVAAEGGNVQLVRMISEADPGAVHMADEVGRIPLHYAAAAAKLNATCYLLSVDDDMRTSLARTDEEGRTPLLLACMSKCGDAFRVINALCSDRSDTSLADRGSKNCLHHACAAGNLDSVTTLLVCWSPPPVGCLDRSNTSPVMYACRSGNLELVKFLISDGYFVAPGSLRPSIHETGGLDGGSSCIREAITSGSIELVEWLVSRGADIESKHGDSSYWPMQRACETANLPMVRWLIEHGIAVNVYTTEETSPLAAACRGGAGVELLNLLLRAGADAKYSMWNGSALHACRNGEQARWLLEHGCPVDARNWRNATALHAAAEGARHEVVVALLEGGANPELQDENGSTPLHVAVRNCGFAGDDAASTMIVRALLAGGANIAVLNRFNDTPLHCGLEYCLPIALLSALLASGCGVDLVDEDGVTPLMVAARYGVLDNIKYLLQRGANANKMDNAGRTALFHAMRPNVNATIGAVRLLIASGADVNKCGSRAAAPLVAAASAPFDNSELIALLVQHGAQVNQRGRHGKTALYCAIYSGHAGNVKALIDAGADVHKEIGIRVGAPLIHAIRLGDEHVVRMLLNAGASPNARDHGYQPRQIYEPVPESNDSYSAYLAKTKSIRRDARYNPVRAPGSALRFALMTNCMEGLVAALVEAGADANFVNESDGSTVLMQVCALNSAAAVAHLLMPHPVDPLGRGPRVDPSLSDAEGWTALHKACQIGGLAIVRMLLVWTQYGVNVNATTNQGEIALMMVAQLRDHEDGLDATPGRQPGDAHTIAQLLISHGANVNARSSGPRWCTALHLAARGHQGPGILQLLIDSGADVTAPDDNYMTPLCFAQSFDAVRALIHAGADVNATDADGNGPLGWFCQSLNSSIRFDDSLRALDLLITSGANICPKTGLLTPLPTLCESTLVSQMVLDECCPAGVDPFIARLLQEPECVRTINEVPANERRTALQQYVLLGRPLHGSAEARVLLHEHVNRTIDKFLEYGADITAPVDGGTLLVTQALEDHIPGDIIIHLIKRGARVTISPGATGEAQLLTAAIRGEARLVEALITAGADCNAVNSSAKTPIMLACSMQRWHLIRTFVIAGADLGVRDLEGMNVLCHAMSNCAVWDAAGKAAIEMLLDAGADPFVVPGLAAGDIVCRKSRVSPFYLACSLLDLGLVKRITGLAGAATSITDVEWTNGLNVVCSAEQKWAEAALEIVQLLLRHHKYGNRMCAAAVSAAEHGHVTILRHLKANGVVIDGLTTVEFTRQMVRTFTEPLPCENDDQTHIDDHTLQKLIALIEAGVDVFAEVETGPYNPRILAYASSPPVPIGFALNAPRASSIMPLLVAAGVDINRPVGRSGRTLLQIAAADLPSPANTERVKLLLSLKGIDVSTSGAVAQSTPALHLAVRGANWEVARLLLAAGAPAVVAGECAQGVPSMGCILRDHNVCPPPDVLVSLARAGLDLDGEVDSDGSTMLMVAIQRNDVELASGLLAAGARPNTGNHRGHTPLLAAIRKNTQSSAAIIKLLCLQHGVDPNSQPEMMFPPLATAAFDCAYLAVAALLECGADPAAPVADGAPLPHMLASAGRAPYALRAIQILLRLRPALVISTDLRGRTALQIAQAAGHSESVQILTAFSLSLVA